ncbi:MAG: HAD family hydrolase [Kiritimatiellia bacterium]
MRKCVFFDRDGVVNVSPGPGYVTSWDEFRLFDEFPSVLRTVTDKGYDAIVVTNQRGVALGIMSAGAVEYIHRNLRALLKERFGLKLLDVLYCPHEHGECDCRKPAPGMLLKAGEKHGIDLSSSWMAGDSARDMEAGRAAGCRTVLIGEDERTLDADYRVADLKELDDLFKRVLA